MKPLLISFVVGLLVGVLYGVIRVKSPAPPIIALLGLLGMVLGEQAGGWLLTKRMIPSHKRGFSSRGWRSCPAERSSAINTSRADHRGRSRQPGIDNRAPMVWIEKGLVRGQPMRFK
jgi:XapX domain-containing protein